MSTEISPMKPRVILADDETSIRQTLAFFLRSENVDVIAEARDGPEALEMCQRLRPALLLTDLRLPVLDAMSVLARLRAEKLPTRVMIYTGSEDERQLGAAVAAQPAALVHKSDDLTDLRTGLRCALAGRMFFSPRPAKLLGKARRPGVTDSLTSAEIELWKLLAGGSSNKAAADLLKKAEKTVVNQCDHLMQKLGVHELSGLVRLAVKEGLIEC